LDDSPNIASKTVTDQMGSNMAKNLLLVIPAIATMPLHEAFFYRKPAGLVARIATRPGRPKLSDLNRKERICEHGNRS
jgi:hypothetical protein